VVTGLISEQHVSIFICQFLYAYTF
jgi:hypothetical protein